MKSPEELDALKNVKSQFIDYEKFEDSSDRRNSAQAAFIDGKTYAPEYDYPGLDSLFDVDDEGKLLQDKKTETYHAVLELEVHRDSGHSTPAEFELYASFHEVRLKRMMLVESAWRMRHAGSSSEQMTARQEFMQLNQELYGQFDTELFNGMMNTEASRVTDFVPAGGREIAIKLQLERYFTHHQFEQHEQSLLDPELLDELGELIQRKYAHILEAVPDTDDDVYYDAEKCQQIMQDALERGDLAQRGWTIEVSEKKSNPSTDVNKKKIFLPSTTRRNAGELRRLIIHEQEVHARRGQNGIDSGVAPLVDGTAEYADVEEGLGVLLECVIAGNMDNPSYHRARERYIVAGLALGADSGIPRDARQTFEMAWRLFAIQGAKDGVISEELEQKSKKKAATHVDNAFRGTNFAMPGTIFTKLKVYFEGLVKNADYFTERKDNLEAALDETMIGKYAHTDPTEYENVHELVAA